MKNVIANFAVLSALACALGALPTVLAAQQDDARQTPAGGEPADSGAGVAARGCGGAGCGGGGNVSVSESGMRGGGKWVLMQDVHALAGAHTSLQRTVEQTERGIRATTTTTDPALAPVLQRHVRDMAALFSNGGRMRMWDPLFAELADVQHTIEVEVKDLPDGVVVELESADAEARKLVRAHAAKVSAFAARGYDALHEATPLPENYARAQALEGDAAPARCGAGGRAGKGWRGCGRRMAQAGQGPAAGQARRGGMMRHRGRRGMRWQAAQ